jgi:hypothetical protein
MFNEFKEFCDTITIKRNGNGTWTDGKFTPGAQTTFSIIASVQTLGSYELEQLPEGRRINKSYKIYTNTQLYSVEDNVDNPDILIIEGKECEVIAVYPYVKIIAPHWKVIAQEKSIR